MNRLFILLVKKCIPVENVYAENVFPFDNVYAILNKYLHFGLMRRVKNIRGNRQIFIVNV